MLAVSLLLFYFAWPLLCMANTEETVTTNIPELEQEDVVTAAELPSGYVSYADIGTAYKIYTKLATWADAEAACANDGGNLAYIDTPQKVEYVRRLRNGLTRIWVGIYRDDKNSDWKGVNDSEIEEYLPWGYVYAGSTRNCVAIAGSTPALRNYYCRLRLRYVCEIPDVE